MIALHYVINYHQHPKKYWLILGKIMSLKQMPTKMDWLTPWAYVMLGNIFGSTGGNKQKSINLGLIINASRHALGKTLVPKGKEKKLEKKGKKKKGTLMGCPANFEKVEQKRILWNVPQIFKILSLGHDQGVIINMLVFVHHYIINNNQLNIFYLIYKRLVVNIVI